MVDRDRGVKWGNGCRKKVDRVKVFMASTSKATRILTAIKIGPYNASI